MHATLLQPDTLDTRSDIKVQNTPHRTVAKWIQAILAFSGLLITATQLMAADVTVYDSIVSLAVNRTKYYTFKDSGSGESVIVALTISPFSSGAGEPFAVRGSGTRVGIGATPTDGDYIDSTEGVDFYATLVFASTGVVPDSVGFRIAGLGLRGGVPNPTLAFLSPTTTPAKSFTVGTEMLYPVDALPAPLYHTRYTAQLRHSAPAGTGYYQLSDLVAPAPGGLKLNVTFSTTSAYPQANSWLTTYAGRYARVFTNSAAEAAGRSSTTWTNHSGSLAQTLPAYSGVQEVASSVDWTYLRSGGLGSYIMGPWTNSISGSIVPFPNFPVNQHSLWRFPRAPVVPVSKTYTPASTIGYFVDGVAMFNSWSGYFWDGTNDVQGPSFGDYGGYWNADAYVTEGQTFDPGMGHPTSGGIQHYHADPKALRYLLGDHVDYDSVSNRYSESSGPVTHHSPILGWVADGFPLYGPYGYSNALDPTSPIVRMRSGYVKRDGSYGTDDLTNAPIAPATTQRTTRPAWAARLFGPATGAPDGPLVESTNHVLGYYMEDYDYLGDHGYKQGVDFDLDEFNGRWCVTPEFPGGTYAYFVAIDTNGTPVFPYDIGRGYYGEPRGGEVAAITNSVETCFVGETNLPIVLDKPTVASGNVTLTWSAVEGGHYQVDSSTNLSRWTVLATNVPATEMVGSYSNRSRASHRFYRVSPNSFDPYDSVK